MAEDQPVILQFPEKEEDEVDDILSVLRHAVSRATSPVIRACLEDAAEDIVHLTGCSDGRQEQDARQAAG